MTKELVPFEFHGHPVRIIRDAKGDPLFRARDVIEILEFSVNSRPLRHLTVADKATVLIEHGEYKGYETFINESGLYKLIFKSRIPGAVEFQDWVTKEVLPSIRKTGSYSVVGAISNEQIVFEMANAVKLMTETVTVSLLSMMDQIAGIKSEQAQIGVKLLKAGALPEVKEIDWRARLNQEMRNLACKLEQPEHDCWNMLYYEDRYRNHRDIKAIARNKGCRPIQIAEDRGWLPELCAIARGIINGEIVSEYRAGAYA